MLVSEMLSKVSEKMSRVAVLRALIEHLEVHYVGLDSGTGAPSMYMTRSDYGIVPQDHILLAVSHLYEEVDLQETELLEWEKLLVVSSDEIKVLAAKSSKVKASKAKRATTAPKKRRAHARSKNPDYPAPDEPG